MVIGRSSGWVSSGSGSGLDELGLGVWRIYTSQIYTQARFPPRPVMGRGVMPILYFSRSAKGSAFHRWPATINTIRAKARARPRARVRARVRARARARVEA